LRATGATLPGWLRLSILRYVGLTRLRQPARPAQVTLEPGARPLTFEYRDGKVRLTVPKVDIHEIVAVTGP
jgi:hypothetical protein